MKKIIATTIMFAIFISSINFISCASCDMDINYKKLIDFSEIIDGEELQSISQTIGDKEVKIWRYEDISKINYYLERDIIKEMKKLIVAQNSRIDPNVLVYLLKATYDLIARTSTAQEMALKEAGNSVSKTDLSKIPEDERNVTAKEGKTKGTVASAAGLATTTATGMGVWEMAKYLAKKGTGKIAQIAGAAIASPVATLATIASVGGFALVVGGFVYNQFYILPLSNKIKNLISVHKDIYNQVYLEVTNHKWIDKNVLITAVPTNSSCTNGYAHFHHVDGVHYNKSQKAIDWEFAQSECQFLNKPDLECYQEAKEAINCRRANQDDPSKCRNNKYYRGTFALEL